MPLYIKIIIIDTYCIVIVKNNIMLNLNSMINYYCKRKTIFCADGLLANNIKCNFLIFLLGKLIYMTLSSTKG